MEEEVDTGFDAVIAGEKWTDDVTVAVTQPVQQIISDTSTGAVTAAVTPGLTDEGKQGAKALIHLPAIEPTKLAQLARDIAMDIKERPLVLKEAGLTQAQYEYLAENNEFYFSALKAACIEWHAPLSTQERIKLEAAALLEDALPGLGARLQNTREQLPGVVEAAKLFAKMAGVGEREAGAAPVGERFVINIDLGGDQKVVVSTGPAPEKIAEQHPQRALSSDGQAPG